MQIPFSKDMLPEGPLAVAVSGGVDSLCALAACKQLGADVFAIHALFNDANAQDGVVLERLEKACERLGVPLKVADLREAFEREVIRPFAQSYIKGLTPNPCSLCNRSMKFGALLDEALSLGAKTLLTGHYAAMGETPEGPRLREAKEKGKDQSYFLCLVPPERLALACFPLSLATKEESRSFVQSLGLESPDPKESQEICFVPREPDHYKQFLRGLCQKLSLPLSEEGEIFLVEKGRRTSVGMHKGLWRYTEGQRQGIGIAWKEPLYVVGKDMERNALLVAPKSGTLMKGAMVGSLNFMRKKESMPGRALARLRYRQRQAPASISFEPDGRMRVVLDSPASISAPGQVAAIYDEDGFVLAGGIMESVLL